MTTTETIDTGIRAGQVGIIHVRVGEADRAAAFFGELFGWQSDPYRDEAFTAHYVINTTILTVLTDDPQAPPVRLFFPVANVAGAVGQVEELGGRVVESELSDGGGWARVEDDQGVPLGVWRPGDSRYGDHTPTARATGEVGYLTIGVPDTARGRAFYSGLLGWRFDPPQPNDYHHVSSTELPLGIVRQDSPSVELYFRIRDLEAMTARVRELGGDVEPTTESPSGLGAVCTDDQGTTFNLWQPAPGYGG